MNSVNIVHVCRSKVVVCCSKNKNVKKVPKASDCTEDNGGECNKANKWGGGVSSGKGNGELQNPEGEGFEKQISETITKALDAISSLSAANQGSRKPLMDVA